MHVESIMSSPAVSIEVDATVQEAIGKMLEHRIGCVVVTDPGIAGILTRSDGLRAAYHAGASLEEIAVPRAMTSDVITTSPDTTVQSALQTMETQEIKKLPVVEDFELVGIVTMTDIARHYPEQVEESREGIERRDEWTD